jgi:hypothetical protein
VRPTHQEWRLASSKKIIDKKIKKQLGFRGVGLLPISYSIINKKK